MKRARMWAAIGLAVALLLAHRERGIRIPPPGPRGDSAAVVIPDAEVIAAAHDGIRYFLHPQERPVFPGTPEIRRNAAGSIFLVAGSMHNEGSTKTHRWLTLLSSEGDDWHVLAATMDDRVLCYSPRLHAMDDEIRVRWDAAQAARRAVQQQQPQ